MSENEYEAAVRELDRLIATNSDPAPGEPDYARVDALLENVMAYERLHYPIPPPLSEAAKLLRREQMGEVTDREETAPGRAEDNDERSE